jgi:hypothetical protein
MQLQEFITMHLKAGEVISLGAALGLRSTRLDFSTVPSPELASAVHLHRQSSTTPQLDINIRKHSLWHWFDISKYNLQWLSCQYEIL